MMLSKISADAPDATRSVLWVPTVFAVAHRAGFRLVNCRIDESRGQTLLDRALTSRSTGCSQTVLADVARDNQQNTSWFDLKTSKRTFQSQGFWFSVT
jgi:hypothetical protein